MTSTPDQKHWVIDDETWARIAREFPKGAWLEGIRTHLERTINNYAPYFEGQLERRKQSKKFLTRLKDATAVLLEYYKPSSDPDAALVEKAIVETGQLNTREIVFQELQELAHTVEASLRDCRKRGPYHPEHDEFYSIVLIYWADRGGKTRASIDPITGKATGPCVRYLVAVASAAGVDLPPDTARQIIKRFRKKRSAPAVGRAL